MFFPWLPNCVFLPCDHGLEFYISLCENSINQSIPRLAHPKLSPVIPPAMLVDSLADA